MSKDAYYLKHDANARGDISLVAARNDASQFTENELSSVAMYGFYFITIEILREQSDYRLEMKKKSIKYIARETATTTETTERFLEILKSEEYKLLEEENGFLFSSRLNRDMQSLTDKRERFIKAGKESARKRYADKEPEQPQQKKEPTKPQTKIQPTQAFKSTSLNTLWIDYCKELGNPKEREKEKKFILERFSERESLIVSKLQLAKLNKKEELFFAEIQNL